MRSSSYLIGLVAVSLVAGAPPARADINVIAWLLSTESCDDCSSAQRSTVTLPAFQAKDAVDNTFGTAGVTTSYDFEVGDDNSWFELSFDGWIDESSQADSGGDFRSVRSFGSIFFRVSPDSDLPYRLDGVYSLTGDSEQLRYKVQLTDITMGTDVFFNDQVSFFAAGETLELGQTDGNSANLLVGDLAGTLTAGHSYFFLYSVLTSSTRDVPGASTSTGMLSLHISPETECGNGIVDESEECDGGDCCTPDCTFAAAGSECGDPTETDCHGADVCDGFGVCEESLADDGTACDDGDACSTTDFCEAGLCVGSADETDPTIACPPDVEAEPTGPDGANVSYDPPTANDNCSGVTVACVRASDELFAIGDTWVTCEATDGAGNTTECSFVVTVLSPEEVVDNLIADVHVLADSGAVNNGQARSLIAKLNNVLRRLAAGQTRAACNVLGAFVNSVHAMVNGGVLTPGEALPLIESAMNARAALECDVAKNGSALRFVPNGRR